MMPPIPKPGEKPDPAAKPSPVGNLKGEIDADGNFTAAAGPAAGGAVVELWPMEWLRLRTEVRRGFGGHDGVVADVFLDAVWRPSKRWTIAGGPRLEFESSNALKPYFGITPDVSARSGLPAYKPSGGLETIGAGVQVSYLLTEQIRLYSFTEYERLVGSAADSPLVRLRGTPDQFTVGTGVTYSFDLKF